MPAIKQARGWAVIYHGYPRSTADIDFLYQPTIENYNRLLEVFKEFGVDISELNEVIFDSKKTFLRIPLGIKAEFLPQIQGLPLYNEV